MPSLHGRLAIFTLHHQCPRRCINAAAAINATTVDPSPASSVGDTMPWDSASWTSIVAYPELSSLIDKRSFQLRLHEDVPAFPSLARVTRAGGAWPDISRPKGAPTSGRQRVQSWGLSHRGCGVLPTNPKRSDTRSADKTNFTWHGSARMKKVWTN